MNVRSAQVDDLPQLYALWHEHITILSQSDPRFTAKPMSAPAWIADIQCRMNDANFELLVAENDGQIIGFIMGEIRNGARMLELALDAHKYHGGAGRLLWNTLRTWFKERNYDRVVLSVPRYYAVEQAFWRALGAVTWNEESCPPEMITMIL